MEKLTNRPPNFTNLKVFGCASYAHMKQGKLDSRALKCAFIGYPEGVKAFKMRCIEPGEPKTFIITDVIFRVDYFPIKKAVLTQETLLKPNEEGDTPVKWS